MMNQKLKIIENFIIGICILVITSCTNQKSDYETIKSELYPELNSIIQDLIMDSVLINIENELKERFSNDTMFSKHTDEVVEFTTKYLSLDSLSYYLSIAWVDAIDSIEYYELMKMDSIESRDFMILKVPKIKSLLRPKYYGMFGEIMKNHEDEFESIFSEKK